MNPISPNTPLLARFARVKAEKYSLRWRERVLGGILDLLRDPGQDTYTIPDNNNNTWQTSDIVKLF